MRYPGARGHALDSSPVSRSSVSKKRTGPRIRPPILFFSCFFKFAPGSDREACVLSIISQRVVWHDLKAHHLAHQTFTDVEALDRAIHTAVNTLNIERNVNPLVQQRISA